LSLVNNLDPDYHVKIGQALQDSLHDGVLVIGSGFSFHNMKAFFAPDTSESKAMNEALFELRIMNKTSSMYLWSDEYLK